MNERRESKSGNRDRKLALSLAGLVVTMVAAAYAAVPLYDLFCRVTGYGGTVRKAETAPSRVTDRDVVIRFDANVSGLAWSFKPELTELTLKAGEVGQIAYVAQNRSARATVGTSIFNVTPASAGAYFNKIECFCFTSQPLQPGEEIRMPVQFFIDPAIEEDSDLDAVRTITLSYTFFPDDEAGQPVAHSVQDEAEKKL